MADDLYLIWSEEHGRWWGPGQCGYTASMRLAGRYSRAQADAICASANIGERFNEVPVRFSLTMSHACDLPGSGR